MCEVAVSTKDFYLDLIQDLDNIQLQKNAAKMLVKSCKAILTDGEINYLINNGLITEHYFDYGDDD